MSGRENGWAPLTQGTIDLCATQAGSAMSRKRSPKDRPEHDSNAQPSKREKHERGERRKRLGKGKEKKHQQPDWFQR
jgi:hypothetical protein